MISAPTKCGESFRPFVGADDLGGPRAAQVCRPYGFNGTVSENETVFLIRPLRGHLPLKGKAGATTAQTARIGNPGAELELQMF